MNKYLLPFFCVVVLLASCEKDDPEIPHEEEVITTLNYTLTPLGGGSSVEFSFRDLDGDGGNAPIISNGILTANTIYTASIEVLNELETPAEDITEEVEEEGAEHQFFFQEQMAGVEIEYTDVDTDGNPVGLSTTVTTGAAENGTLTITLRHEPSKDASGVAGGDITNAGGETDIEVEFDVEVQ